MKTLTEFDGFYLKNALAKKKELTAAGKTAEELPQALGEELKVEGDRLTYLLAALEVVEERSENLKRVVVYSVDEGKSAPGGAVAKGDKHYLPEFFFVPSANKGRDARGDRGGRGAKGERGKGRGKGRGDKRGGGRGEKRAEGGGGGGRGGDRKPREPRAPRTPGAKPNVKPVNAPQAATPSDDKTQSS